MIEQFHFLRPGWLLLRTPLPLILWFMLWARYDISKRTAVVAVRLLPFVSSGDDQGRGSLSP